MASFFLRSSASNLPLGTLATMTSAKALPRFLRPRKRSRPSRSSPNLNCKSISPAAFDSTVSAEAGGPPPSVVSGSDSPPGCFSSAGNGEETAVTDPSIGSFSCTTLDPDNERLLYAEGSAKRNPSSNGSVGSLVATNVGKVNSDSVFVSSVPIPEEHKERSLSQVSLIENPGYDSLNESGDGSCPAEKIPVPISGDQRKRMEINGSLARAKRNLRICTERVSKARAEGLGSFKLEELLVEGTWVEALSGEFQKPYMKNLCRFVECEMGGSIAIYPPPFFIFNALNSTPLNRLKAVIIGQDPYHGPGQAMGLCFSVPEGVKIPSSLVNIFKELRDDLGCFIPSHGNLERWAIEGVLLLNTVLTVRQHQANSHAKRGWEVFTDAVIQTISQQRDGVVFLLWGNSAQEKSRLINVSKHCILKAAHPSGLSAHRGFFGCRHFSKTNQILERSGLLPIDWQL